MSKPGTAIGIDKGIKDCFENEGDQGDADLFASLYDGKVCYDHSQKSWYLFNGNSWEEDTTNETVEYISKYVAPKYYVLAEWAANPGNTGYEKKVLDRIRNLRSRKKIQDVLFMATTIPTIKLRGNEWDRDPWLLGVKNGVVDLRTGILEEGNPWLYIKTPSPTDWIGLDEPAPRFEQFIMELFNFDMELVTFIQRVLGYGITGLTREHILPIFWGEEGRNGKTTLLETLKFVLGENLASSIPSASLMRKNRRGGDNIDPFVYELRGRRLVWTSESERGDSISAGLVKKLTGGDQINVRTVYKEPIKFDPSHLTIMITNNRPAMPADDHALWERILLIPFTQKFIDNPKKPNEHQRDSTMREHLMRESPGILAWLVRGCLSWQDQGLNIPDTVKVATKKYQIDEDYLQQFIVEVCKVGPGYQVKKSTIYKEYLDWCSTNNIHILDQLGKNIFYQQMSKMFNVVKNSVFFYEGIGI